MKKIYQSMKALFATDPSESVKVNGTKRPDSLLVRLLCLCMLFLLTGATFSYGQAISGPTVVCANSSQMYTTSYTTGYTYVWSVLGAAGNSSSSNTLVVTYGQSPIGTGGNCLITLMVLNATGSTVATGSLVVHVNPTPIPEIITLSSIGCNGSPVEYDLTIPLIDPTKDYCYKVCDSTIFKYQVGSTFDPTHTYQWSVIPASAAIAITATPTTGEVEVQWGAPSGANSYILRLSETDPITGCSDSVDICVRIISRPNAAMSTFPASVGGVVNICFNSSVAFFDQSTSDPNSQIVSYLWDFGDGSYSTQQFPTHAYTASGTFYAKLIVENQCHCRDSVMVQIDVDGQPGPDIYCISPRCYNTSDSYCTSYTCTTFNWSVTNGTITSSPSNTACIDVSWGTNGPGSIVLTPDASCGGCPYATSVLVPILTPTSVVTGPNPACENQISYYSVPNLPATSYNWQVIPAGTATLINGQGTNVLGLYFGAGPVNATVQVVYTNLFLGCSGSAALPVKVAPKMTLVGDSILCTASTGTYASNSSSANWWIVSPGGSTVYSTSGVSSISYSFASGGAYVVYAQDITGNFCASPQAYQVQVISQPPMPSANINTVICPGSVIQYVAAPSNNNYFLHWQITGGTPNQTSGNAISVLWGASGPYSITLTQQQVMPPSCISNPLVITMGLPSVPTPTINTSNATPCFNQSVNYTSAFTAGSYTWQLAPNTIGSISQGAGSNNITIQYNNSAGSTPSVASILLIVENCGTTNSTVLTVTVGAPNAPTIVVPNLCTDQSANFGTTTSPSGTYAWDFGDGTTGSGMSPAHTYTSAAPYVVNLIVTNPAGCTGTVSTATIVNVNQTPLASITSSDVLLFCDPGASFTFALYASLQTLGSGVTYTWGYAGSPVSNATSFNATVTGIYTLSVSSANGCVYTTTVDIDDNACGGGTITPCTLATNPSTLTIDYTLSCNSVTFGLSSISPAGNLVLWDFGPTIGTSTSATPIITFPSSGYYPISVIYEFPASGGGWCAVAFNTVVLVPVVADFKVNFSCGTSALNVNFIDQSNWVGTTPSFSWNTTPGSYNSTNANFTVTNMPGNTYVVTHTATSGAQSCVITKTVVVPTLPNASFTATNSICEGNPVIFVNTSTPTTGIAQYYWNFGDLTSLITQNPNPNGVRVYTGGPSTYSTFLNVTDVYGCQSAFGSVNISVNQNMFNLFDPLTSTYPNLATITPTISQICNGGTVNICAASNNPNSPFGYMWNTFATTSCITASQSGFYSVIIIDNYGCKSNRPYASLNVINVPPPVIFGRQSYCEGESPLLSINKGTGYSYQWIYATTDASMITSTGSYTSTACSSPLFPPTPSSCALSPALNTNPTGTLALSGLITENSSGLNCQAQWGVVTITIHPLPPAPTVGTDACETGGFITLNATPTGTGTVSSILWNTGQQGSSINAISSGGYWARVIDEHGCASVPDTAHIWPLPDFNSLIYGCYDICNTGTTIVPVPIGTYANPYTSYEWIKQGVGTIVGPNSFYTPLVLTNPSSFTTNAGVYQLVLTTNHGCIGTSKTIEFNVVTCYTCDASFYNPQFDNIVCVHDPVTGAPSYNFQISITNPGGSPVNFTLTTGNGNLNLSPAVTMLNPGANVLTGNFIPVLGVTKLCVHFAIQENPEFACGLDLCVDLPVCNSQLSPCRLDAPDLTTWCLGVTNGIAEYGYNFNFNYTGSYSGTITMSSYQGFMNQSTTIVNPGANSISGTFTDTPAPDGTVCFDIVIQSIDDDGVTTWCQDRICVELDPNPPCKPNLPACSLTLNNTKSVCYYKNSFGQIAYVISYDINNGSSDTYSFYVVSSQGILGSPSPALIYPSGSTSYTQSFLETTPSNPQCFTIIATNLSNGKQCEISFCINPDPCDPGQLRLAATVEVNFYPNPSNDYAIAEYALESKDLADRFTLIDMSGRIVQEIRLQDTRGKVEFNTSSLQAGMYFMKIMNGGQTVMVKKLIIQR